ncbi:4'-phosphopantetheinyl transferase superfamily protein [Curtobacterium sp. ISL-83]|uniref:4'-phosphopantetheinyl transferase family protein n=1 Tax=Curtobacterium sp. ISL-83 TaxID=2819145 RepID=UPI001BE9BC35|nr:4'-phosphopantetheinyl transferase superfamily protein [Curtobacterium sp. ISL-83]MBT2503343.1 4'-phosphopantetheinyl transferase superfamily protein [Curtobacterium sp. ISL-83]
MSLRAPGAHPSVDREALVAAVATVAAVDTVAVRAGRVCQHCGATDHGRPWATVHGEPVGVSLSRAPGTVALAVGPGPLGVDVERVSRVAAAPLDVFTAGEVARAAGDPAVLAACWAGKEAVLKRDGRGLRVDPASVDVDVLAAQATFEGSVQPLVILHPEPDLVLVVAAGGAAVSVQAG